MPPLACPRERRRPCHVLLSDAGSKRSWYRSVGVCRYSIILTKPQARALGCERTAHIVDRIELHCDLLQTHMLCPSVENIA